MADFIPKTPPIWQTQLAFELDPADLTATVATELLIGGGSLSGLVCVSVDIGQPNPEYILGTLVGNVLTITLRNVDPLDPTVSLGAFTSIHRQGAVVKITDFATIQIMRNILNGNKPLQNTISYDVAKTPLNPQDIVDKGYVDAISVAGAPDASTTAKGVSRITASPNVTLGNPTITIASPAVVTLNNHGLTVNDTVQFTTSGSLPTGISPSTNYFVISAGLTANAFEISATIGGTAINTTGSQSGTHTLIKTTPVSVGANDYRINGGNYGASSGGTDTYAITLTNAPTAYVTGQVFWFLADVANTGACTLNVNGLGAKNLKVNGNLTPQDNYIKANQLVGVIYDGTSMQIFSVSGKPSVSQSGEEIYGVPNGGTDTYAITVAPAPSAYVAGQVFRFKADVANTGAATLNVNSLGAVTIVKSFNVTLADGDIKAGQLVEVEYDGTNFQMLSPVGNSSTNIAVRTIPLGEAFTGATTPQPAVIIDDLFQNIVNDLYVFGGNTNSSSVGTLRTNKIACKIIPRSNVTAQNISCYLAKFGTPTGNVTVEIQTDSAGAPSNTPIANGTSNNLAASGLPANAPSLQTIAFASPFSLVAGTTYWVVFKESDNSDTNNVIIQVTSNVASVNGGAYASFTGMKAISTTWSAADNSSTPSFKIIPSSGAGSLSLWRAIGGLGYAGSERLNEFQGFCTTTGSAGANGTLSKGNISGFSLLGNTDYYVSSSVGSITTNSTQGGMYVGTTDSTGTIVITKFDKQEGVMSTLIAPTQTNGIVGQASTPLVRFAQSDGTVSVVGIAAMTTTIGGVTFNTATTTVVYTFSVKIGDTFTGNNGSATYYWRPNL